MSKTETNNLLKLLIEEYPFLDLFVFSYLVEIGVSFELIKCPNCNKIFAKNITGRTVYCSEKCLREYARKRYHHFGELPEKKISYWFQQKEEIEKMLESGCTLLEIAKKYDRSIERIRQICKKYKLGRYANGK